MRADERVVALHTLAEGDHFKMGDGEYVVTGRRLSPTDKVRVRAVTSERSYPYPGNTLVVPIEKKEE